MFIWKIWAQISRVCVILTASKYNWHFRGGPFWVIYFPNYHALITTLTLMVRAKLYLTLCSYTSLYAAILHSMQLYFTLCSYTSLHVAILNSMQLYFTLCLILVCGSEVLREKCSDTNEIFFISGRVQVNPTRHLKKTCYLLLRLVQNFSKHSWKKLSNSFWIRCWLKYLTGSGIFSILKLFQKTLFLRKLIWAMSDFFRKSFLSSVAWPW